MKNHCLNCNEPLENKRGGAKFCSLECKNEYSYKVRQGRLDGFENLTPASEQDKPEVKETPLEDSLKSFLSKAKNEANNMAKPYKEPPSIDAEIFKEIDEEKKLPPLKNTISYVDEIIDTGDDEAEDEQDPGQLRGDENEAEAETETKKEPEKLLPVKFIEKTVVVSNPARSNAQKTIDEKRLRKEQLEKQLKHLEGELTNQQARDGNGLMIAGGLGAALYGFLQSSAQEQPLPEINKNKKFIPKSKKKKSPPQNTEPTFMQRLLKGLLYGAVGTGAGYLAKESTGQWREQDKKEAIERIKKRIEATKQEIMDLQTSINRNTMLLAMIPKQITEKQKTVNPEWVKSLMGAPKKNEDMKQPEKNKIVKPKFKSDKIIRSTELRNQNFDSLNFKGLWREFFGLPSVNFHALIHGNSGEGKSTFCLWLARYLAQNFGRVLYVSSEEGYGKTFYDKLISCKADVPNMFLCDVRTGDEFMNEVGPEEFHFIILDSLHDMEIDARKLKTIFEKYKNTAFICIDQNNKKGELLGANEKKHIVDVVVNVKNYIAETTKNRFKAKGVIAKTMDFTDKAGAKIIELNPKKRDDNNGYNLNSDRKGLV